MNRVLVISGVMQSGLSVLDNCARLLGVQSFMAEGYPTVNDVFMELFRKLKVSPTGTSPMPEGWGDSAAAQKASDSLVAIGEACSSAPLSCVVVPQLSRILPLWQTAMDKLGLEPVYIHLVRHPWEVVPSLTMHRGMSSRSAYLYWFDQARFFSTQLNEALTVPFARLLDNPVKVMGALAEGAQWDWPVSPYDAREQLMQFVRADLPKHTANDASADMRTKLLPGAEAYAALEALSGPEASRPATGDVAGTIVEKRDRALSDLADNPGWLTKGELPTTSAGSHNISLTIEMPGEERHQRFFVQPGKWVELSFPLDRPDVLAEKPLLMLPQMGMGMLSLARVSLENRLTGETVWEAVGDSLGSTGVRSLVKLAGQEGLRLAVVGAAPRVELPAPVAQVQCPAVFKVLLKLVPDQNDLVALLPADTVSNKETVVGTIHHLSCSGGTVISRCLAAMQDVVLLSEVNPMSPLSGGPFNPLDPLYHLHLNYPELRVKDPLAMRRSFLERVAMVQAQCEANGKFLIFRDHPHSDFLLAPPDDHCPTYDFLTHKYTVKPIVTLRDPVDSYLSLRFNTNFPTDVESFDTYCARVRSFLERYSFAEIFLYEDFVDDPSTILRAMCNVYGIDFSEEGLERFTGVVISGNSGRGSNFKTIERLERRKYPLAFKAEIAGSKNYMAIVEQYYTNRREAAETD